MWIRSADLSDLSYVLHSQGTAYEAYHLGDQYSSRQDSSNPKKDYLEDYLLLSLPARSI